MFGILNAATFAGEWTDQFKLVENDFFYLSNGDKYKVPMMKDLSDYYITMGESLAMLSKPFGNKSFYVGFLLPDESVTLNDAISSVDAESWEKLREKKEVDLHEVFLKVPKLDITEEYDMLRYFKDLGMHDMGDFSELGTEAILSLSRQKTHFLMDEKGAKAEVAQITTGAPTSPGVWNLKDFVLDRPFAFVIYEQSTGAIMFAGKVEKP